MIYRTMTRMTWMRLLLLVAMLIVQCSMFNAFAQIKIGGNVYGGGNQGEIKGSTKVTVYQGDLNKVFGGARMANVGGNAYVNIDGAHASGYMLINYLYGGNDIAGTIGSIATLNATLPEDEQKTLPDEIKDNKDGVNLTWNTYVHLSTKLKGDNSGYADPDAEKVFIGQLFAGGNGDYPYEQVPGPGDGQITHNIYLKEGDTTPIATKVTNEGDVGFQQPEVDKAYLDVQGGTIVYAYGGGNNVTVKEKAVIHVDNPSEVVTELWLDADSKEQDSGSQGATNVLANNSTRLKDDMGIKTAQEHVESDEFQMARLFGGNNRAEMAIRPTWNLQSGKIRNLYSGGNRGAMTSSEGLLLEINPNINNVNPLVVDNVYGGCRMADVMPTVNGVYKPCTNLTDKDDYGNLIYKFPDQLSARVLIRGGDINNVYGGNDVTGTVYGGNAIGVYTSIRGDVYGGGNGAYAYTNKLKDDEEYGDYYYEDDSENGDVTKLNAHRPNAEQVSIRLAGTSEYPTVINGSVFVGGNCASLDTKSSDPMVELKIGSYVIADQVFMGNNGERMIDPNVLKLYKDDNFSSLDLKDAATFAGYMEGVAMDLQPDIVFDAKPKDPDNYEDYSTQIGSFYCGGNVGSMAIPGKNKYEVDRGLIIFEKFVAGCNNANVPASENNAAYDGGVLGASDERGANTNDYYTDTGAESGQIKDRIELDLENLTIVPMRWKDDKYTEVTAETVNFIEEGKLKAGEAYYTDTKRSSRFIAKGTEVVGEATTFYKLTEKGTELEWNTVKWDTTKEDYVPIGTDDEEDDDADRRLLGGNVYGGCYNSGHVNGNVIININEDIIKKDEIFEEADEDDPYTVANGVHHSGVLMEAQGDDVQAVAMSVFGGGYGKDSEIWGSTTINHNNGYAFQLFGGGEKGVVGKKADGSYAYNAAYSSTVNLKGSSPIFSSKGTVENLAESEYIYGGGNEGDVCGDTYVYLGNGRVYDAFGGACNASVLGHTEVYIGHNDGFPWVRDNVFGGNDFGGSIKGKMIVDPEDITSRNVFDPNLLQSSTYVKYIQGRVDSIFGGCFGNYYYNDQIYNKYTDDNGVPKDGFSFPHIVDNSFVHFQPVDNPNNQVSVIFGGSAGYPGDDDMNNSMQEEAYVLIDDTETRDANQFANTDVYGGGAFAGVGTSSAIGAGHTVVDLYAGTVNNVYGGSNREGMIGYTRVNVPAVSTIKVNALYGGGKGYDPEVFEDPNNSDYEPALAARYCDNYVACIDYQSPNAAVENGIYGGNRNCRIAFDTYINIGTAVKNREGKLTTVYGAGYGKETVSGRTNVFLNDGAQVKEVYGGGRDGNAYNFESLKYWLGLQFAKEYVPQEGQTSEQIAAAAQTAAEPKVKAYGGLLQGFRTYIASNTVVLPSPLPAYNDNLWTVSGTSEAPDLVDTKQYHNTNVHIMAGAEVKGNPKATGGTDGGYAYAGGLGENAVVGGTTYIELKGGTVEKDIYAGGTSGPVYDEYKLGTSVFTAGTYANIESGICRNVYGGGWRGHVGYAKYINGSNILYQEKDGSGNVIKTHYEQIPDFGANYANDILGESHVTIGKIGGTGYQNGIPAIRRNVYGGGEGGAIFGTAHVTINNGYIGYRAEKTGSDYNYLEELDDYQEGDNKLKKHGGNVFGGGYVANSYVDNSEVKMYGGTIRGELFGGGEIGPIGRGTVKANAPTPPSGSGPYFDNHTARIYKPGSTKVEMYGGFVQRNVFGGGRGYDNWETYGWMSDVEKQTMDQSSKGYVFGNTEVYIYGGKIGTVDAASYEDGNVFGGGDEGFVYSATGTKSSTDGYYYSNNITSYKCTTGYTDGETNYTSGQTISVAAYANIAEANKTNWDPVYGMTEDCKVVVSPYCLTKKTLDNYVTTDVLNTYSNGSEVWSTLDQTGIDIANAVFAGGNISAGSDKISVNETTVFGNATASVTDVFAKDLITIGEDGVGGLYGDGNLTFVDGYRELNITNYGTDYYNLSQSLSLEEYKKLSDRERAYFELLYKPKTERELHYYESKGTHVYHKDEHTDVSYKRGQKLDANSTEWNEINNDEDEKENWSGPHTKKYGVNERISQDDYNLLWAAEQVNWELYGFCTLYAGRMINTIQRADFCGVFGSRVVMRGAQDRVPKTVDYTEYTINRVKEVSLNKQYHPAHPEDPNNPEQTDENFEKYGHGNYFGIYNVVNYLGALTSDEHLDDIRKTSSTESTYTADFVLDGTTYKYGQTGATYENWKKANLNNRRRNNGSSPNEVALASGVWLEILDESTETQPNKEKVYGPITGIVELTLINVAPGEGGGYVYAKNIHGVRSDSHNEQVTLAAANDDARSYKMYTYSTPTIESKMQTSGNFVNSAKRIIDDCYPLSGAYYNREGGEVAAPAHYWFIRGDYYVYDQYISAYTGSSQAYAENVSIPLTITAESQGRLQLAQVQPNLYAYWSNINQISETYRSHVDREAILVGGTTYKLNDPIDYWTWSHLSTAEKNFFTEETWVCNNDATYGTRQYKKGDVFSSRPADIYVCKEGFIGHFKDPITEVESEITYHKGDVLEASVYNALLGDGQSNCAAVFNVSNALNHDNGFLLTFDWDNPDVWNDYYHHPTNDATVRASVYNKTPGDYAGYITSPSFKFGTSGSSVLGQSNYIVGDVIDATTYLYEINNIAAPDTNGDMVSKKDQQGNNLVTASTQAKFDKAYIAVTDHNFTVTVGNEEIQYVPNACISEETYAKLSSTDKENFKAGKLCTTTYEYTVSGKSQYIVTGTIIPESTYNTYVVSDANAAKYFSDGYICTDDGLWGGTVFNGGQHYPAIKYSNLSKEERGNFTYNYDALDLLVDPTYNKENDMSVYDKEGASLYSGIQSIDYEATYTGTSDLDLGVGETIPVKYYDSGQKKFIETTRTRYVKNGDIITNTQYENLTNEAINYTPIVITADPTTSEVIKTYYVVNTGFQIGDKWYSEGNLVTEDIYDGLSNSDKNNVDKITFNDGVVKDQRFYYCTKGYTAITAVTDINNSPHAAESTIDIGTIIPESGYSNLVNQQKNFSINGKTPTETSTLYVAREVDINSLSKDRIITVVYHYDYLESDDSGNSYEKIREYHVVNVHVHFESGMPTIGELLPPGTVLPGDVVTLNQPTVTKGAYELLGGGWEVFPDQPSADTHKNGTPFSSSGTPLYWYQDGHYVAYYALSYLGKSYSNAVPLSVANYHRMNEVLDINEGGTVTTENNYMYLNEAVKEGKRDPKVYVGNDIELKKMAAFFNETHTKGGTNGELSSIKDCQNIDFIIDGDIAHTGSWTPIANNSGECFEGTIHGDGHTISGLTPAGETTGSLIGNLCKDVYNLGVTGSFTGAGVADTGDGYVENCWVKSSATVNSDVMAVFGNPSRSEYVAVTSGTKLTAGETYYTSAVGAGEFTSDGTEQSDGTNYYQKRSVIQVVNSYYPESNHYNVPESAIHGKPIQKPDKAFYNGEVAYDLNNFFLNKRYYDGIGQAAGTPYHYFKSDANGELTNTTGYYPAYTVEVAPHGNIGYVENRYLDGDFRYAGGSIPTAVDDRCVVVDEITGKEEFYPIWPDDYLFFGQKLTYGYSTAQSHQDLPSVIVKEGGRLPEDSQNEQSNRVYRAPAYFRSKDIGVAHFNPRAYLAAKSSDDTKEAYPGMTAIDFAGHQEGHAASAYAMGLNASGHFYPPLLDDDGLFSVVSKGETQNLLVYAPAETSESGYANKKTYDVLNDYFIGTGTNRSEPLYSDYTESSDKYTDGKNYGRVAVANTLSIYGHLVQSNLKTTTDHMLVDKQDFNCPIGYQMGSGYRMWYQRTPDNNVTTTWSDGENPVRSTKGWQAISLPFTSEVVTTHQKGEITHFYSGSEASKNGTGSKIGHEYWLREFKGINAEKSTDQVKVANLNYPVAPTTGDTKNVTNTFLWDYYYQGLAGGHDQKDKNTDTYQEYYKESRAYEKYAFQAGGTPYLLGLPGLTFYEFDLSGQFEAKNTAVAIDKLDKQVLTFASAASTSQEPVAIAVSDGEMAGVTNDGYTFKPTYLNNPDTEGKTVYLLDSNGDSFDKTEPNAVNITAFRPYFVQLQSNGRTRGAEEIVFSQQEPELKGAKEHGDPKDDVAGRLNVYVLMDKIYVESSLNYATDVRIVTAAGITVANFTVQPGQTIEVQADFSGMYIVHTVDGRYMKKVAVKK